MVGTNWGARQYRRAREVAWTGAGTVAATCAVIGIFFAIFPRLWLGLFSDAEDIVSLGTSYLRVVGPFYSLYGLGMGLYFATQGFGNALWTVAANAVRLIVSSACALTAVYWVGLGALGFFVSIAVGFCAYAALTLVAALRVREPLPAQAG
jgi:Na+-driven multidrug efflux pump